MPIIYFDLAQGSADWYNARSGIPTASNFHLVMTPKQRKASASRFRYGATLVLERLMNWQADSLEKIDAIAKGKEYEPLAVSQLELIYEIETRPVGFITTDDKRFGASPDRVAKVSPDQKRVGIVVEAKSPTPLVQMQRFLFPNEEYELQVQGQIWVSDAERAIFYSFNPRMPAIKEERGRDETVISELRACLERFDDELNEWTDKARRWGPYQAFEKILPPAEVEHATNLHAGRPNWGEGPMTDEELDDLIYKGKL